MRPDEVERGRVFFERRAWTDAYASLARADREAQLGQPGSSSCTRRRRRSSPRSGTARRLRPFSTGRTYINFQTADEGEDCVRETYGANYARLVEVKAAYDPENVFRSNRNVRPG